ncbi:MAG TPA: TCR/Tet family MFS transporter [Bacteroidia bacterium]|jgi:DHA1 family tetracycline resistance protein-like MFS transporter|nr:TCR/Tet family MFS transporter [Bacteroidia bacterium]
MTVKKSNALAFIFVTILIDVIGFGIIIPVMPDLIRELTGEDLSRASFYNGILLPCFAIMQFLFSPLLGALSDRYGRRPLLLIALLGLGIDYVFQAFAPTLAWLFVGRILAGICGASFTTATAYISDISTPEKKAQNFGLIGVAFGVGFIIGPVIGGLCSSWGTRAAFMVAAGFSLLNCIYGYFILPESLPKEQRRKIQWERTNPLTTLLNLKRYPIISGLVFTMLLLYLAAHAVQSNWSFYTMLKFNWDGRMVGISLGIVGLLIAVVQGGLIRKIIPLLGEKNAIYSGLILYAIGLILFAIANTGWLMLFFLVPYCLGGICGPALQSVISNQVPTNEQGELQGSLTSLISVTSIIGPPMMNYLFSYFTSASAPVYFPGAPFILGAILIIVGIFFAINSLRSYHRSIGSSSK